ncbi:MAG: hypothetical protein ACI8QF_003558, partial [Limisphaerales bacterium]
RRLVAGLVQFPEIHLNPPISRKEASRRPFPQESYRQTFSPKAALEMSL